MAPQTLPCEGEIPERYAGKLPLKLMYCEGFQDAARGKSMQDQDAVRRHQSYNAWEAYCAGYAAGTKRRQAEQPAA